MKATGRFDVDCDGSVAQLVRDQWKMEEVCERRGDETSMIRDDGRG